LKDRLERSRERLADGTGGDATETATRMFCARAPDGLKGEERPTGTGARAC